MIQVRFAMMLAALAIVLVVVGAAAISKLSNKESIQPPDACREASTALYGHIGAMMDEITQQALIKGSYTAGYIITSDGEMFPRAWHDFVQACVPQIPVEGGTG